MTDYMKVRQDMEDDAWSIIDRIRRDINVVSNVGNVNHNRLAILVPPHVYNVLGTARPNDVSADYSIEGYRVYRTVSDVFQAPGGHLDFRVVELHDSKS